MKELLIKILFSAFALLLSFIFKIDIVKKILLILPIIVLLENDIREAIKRIKKKNIFNEYTFIILSSILLIISLKLTILLEALLFFSLKDYLYYKLVEPNKEKIISSIRKDSEKVSLKTPSGLMQVPLKETKVGDIIYLEKGKINQAEGILLSENNSYVTLFTKKEIKVETDDYIPSGVVLLNDALIKIKRNYQTSSYYKMGNLLEQLEDKDTEKTLRLERRINKLLYVISIGIIALIYKDVKEIIPIVASIIFLIEMESLKRIETMILFKYIYRVLKEDIFISKESLLEDILKIKNIVFSKEGVVTNKLELAKIVPVYQTKEEILEKAVYAEEGSTHPYAKALRNYKKIDIEEDKIYFKEEIKGKGVRAIIDGEEIYVGSNILFDELNITYPKIDFQMPTCLIAINKTYAGTFVFSTSIKEDIYLTSSLLREEGIERIVLISSSEKEQIKKIGSRLSMNESYASLTLEEKGKVLDMYKKEAKTLYVDAYDLNQTLRENSDITVTLGSNKEIDQADIILPTTDINDIVKFIKIAKKRKKNQKFLRITSLIIKALLLGLILFNLCDIAVSAFIYLLIFFIEVLTFYFNI